MTTVLTKQTLTILLMGLMALTRFHHFGSAFSVPDASLAVFFLAGMGFKRVWFFALLALEAGFIDYVAITQLNVSDFCISPAYVCLIPTYLAMWLAGRYCIAFNALHFADSVKTFALALLATSVAYLVSNGSFYVLSGKFGQLSWGQYFNQFSHYYPAYISATLLYIFIGLAIAKFIKSMQLMTAVES
jgi:hypothetical protein